MGIRRPKMLLYSKKKIRAANQINYAMNKDFHVSNREIENRERTQDELFMRLWKFKFSKDNKQDKTPIFDE